LSPKERNKKKKVPRRHLSSQRTTQAYICKVGTYGPQIASPFVVVIASFSLIALRERDDDDDDDAADEKEQQSQIWACGQVGREPDGGDDEEDGLEPRGGLGPLRHQLLCKP
jgi:hypothetical protein